MIFSNGQPVIQLQKAVASPVVDRTLVFFRRLWKTGLLCEISQFFLS